MSILFHVLEVAGIVLGVWTLIAVPVALIAGRVLRDADPGCDPTPTPPMGVDYDAEFAAIQQANREWADRTRFFITVAHELKKRREAQ